MGGFAIKTADFSMKICGFNRVFDQWKISDLVGGLEHGFYISHILGIIIPFDFHIFQRGRSTTNQQPSWAGIQFFGLVFANEKYPQCKWQV
jgi:hypothetical protein